jgi:hypothetical protein
VEKALLWLEMDDGIGVECSVGQGRKQDIENAEETTGEARRGLGGGGETDERRRNGGGG